MFVSLKGHNLTLLPLFYLAEIPSLLNLAPSPGSSANSEEALDLNAVSQQSTSSQSAFVPVPAPAPPSPENIVSTATQKKRDTKTTANKSHKRIKLAVMSRPTATHMLQAIRPLTELPSSADVRGRSAQNNGINTSTAHVKALTGANGAAVCLDAIEKALQESGNAGKTDACTLSSVDSNGKPLSAEEKAKQSRDRNRQHARNTRVRKKAYVEELKRTLNQLVEERDTVVYQKRMEQQGIFEQRDVRFRVIEDFLNLRGRDEPDPHRWNMILEEGFQLRLPRADVPGVVCSSGGNNNVNADCGPCHSYPLGTSKKVLTGVQEVVEDSRMVAKLLQSLGASPLSVSYQCDRESFMMDNANAVVNWKATSSGAVTKVGLSCSIIPSPEAFPNTYLSHSLHKGANAEFSIEGSLRARFNPISNKLLHMEFSF